MTPRLAVASTLGAAGVFAAAVAIGLAADRAAPGAEPSTAQAVARSLAGTTPDGAAVAAADDTLVLEPALIRRFDYFLSTLGERPLDAVHADIDRDLDAHLRPGAARQAKALAARYLRFRAELAALAPRQAPTGRAVDTLRENLRRMQAVRDRWFDAAETAALFARADADATAALERMAVEQDRTLSADERRDRLARLDAALPADVRAARDAPLLPTRLQDDAERLRAQGASEDEVYRMRAQAVSPEAANRLAELDRAEADWKARIATWQAERRRILAAPDDDAHRQQALAALRARLFTPEEQLRLGAYEG